MQSGLHAIGWGLQRFAIGLGLIVFVPVLLYAILVFVVVAGQAATGFAQ